MTDITAGAEPEHAQTPPPEAAPETVQDPASRPRRVHPWTDTAPHPWRRYFARSVDIILLGLPAVFVVGGMLALFSPELVEPFTALLDGLVGQYLLSPLLLVGLSIPLTALFLGLTGGTPGKWLFGVRVVNAEGRPIGVGAALVREFKASTVGLGMGLPLLSLFLGFQAKEELEAQRATSWDRDGGFVVTHRAVNAWQVVLMIIGGAIFGADRVLGLIDRFAGAN